MPKLYSDGAAEDPLVRVMSLKKSTRERERERERGRGRGRGRE